MTYNVFGGTLNLALCINSSLRMSAKKFAPCVEYRRGEKVGSEKANLTVLN